MVVFRIGSTVAIGRRRSMEIEQKTKHEPIDVDHLNEIAYRTIDQIFD